MEEDISRRFFALKSFSAKLATLTYGSSSNDDGGAAGDRLRPQTPRRLGALARIESKGVQTKLYFKQ